MSNTLHALWNDQKAFIVSAELILISTVGVLGVLVGLHAVSNAVVAELNDVASAIGAVNQSYHYRGVSKWGHAYSIGSGYNDRRDYCDCLPIVDLAPSVKDQRVVRPALPPVAAPVPHVAPVPAVPCPSPLSTPPCPPAPRTSQSPNVSSPPCSACPSMANPPNLSRPAPVPSPNVPKIPNAPRHNTTSKGSKATDTDKVVPTVPKASASQTKQPAVLHAPGLSDLETVSSR